MEERVKLKNKSADFSKIIMRLKFCRETRPSLLVLKYRILMVNIFKKNGENGPYLFFFFFFQMV